METVQLHCLDCGHVWAILCPIRIEDGEEVVRIDIFEDLCPLCESQGEINEKPQLQGQAG